MTNRPANYGALNAKAWLGGWMLGMLLLIGCPAYAAFPSVSDRANLPPFTKFKVPDGKNCPPDKDLLAAGLPVTHTAWVRLGGPNGRMGCPIDIQRHTAEHVEVTFENGTIVTNTRIWEKGYLAAYQEWNGVKVDWAIDAMSGPGPGPPVGLYFHKFLVRWQEVGFGYPHQIDLYADNRLGGAWNEDTHLWTKGTYFIDLKYEQSAPTVYTVVVKGCDVFPSRCPQDWLGPVNVRMTWPPPPLNQFAIVDFEGSQPPESVEASQRFFFYRASRAILQQACGEILPWTNFRNEAGSALIALAKMAYAEVFRTDRCPGRDIDNRQEVAAWLSKQQVESASGTSYGGWAIHRTGEYDTALTGYIALLYAFGEYLPSPVYDHVLLTLLNKSGPVDESDHSISVLGIPETENHILNIESSRYLINQLLCDRERTPRCDNGSNGMTQWMLAYLRNLLANDFLEYNSNPYQDYALTSVMNLYSYARDDSVKTAAQMVLDYIFVKAAASTDDLRRTVPFRRKRTYFFEDDKFFYGRHPDPMVGFLAQLAGNNRLLGWAPAGMAYEMVWAAISEYRIPPPVLDVIVNRESRTFYQMFKHYTTEIYFGSRGYTISAGGLPTVRLYGPDDDNLGIVAPTLLLPFNRAWGSRNETVSFPVNSFDRHDSNICVAPNFACGKQLLIPEGYEPLATHDGPWTFINDANLVFQRPPSGYQPGYYLALYSGPGIAFLEAYDLARERGALTFEQFVDGVKERNGASTFQPGVDNRYVMTDGTVIEFWVSAKPLGFGPSIVSINGSPPWPGYFTSGSIADSEGQTAFLRIRNPNPKSRFANCELILDYRDPAHPIREMHGPQQLCNIGDPGTFGDYKPCDPIVFVPAPDAPGERLSQAWGDRGFWDRDNINVRLRELRGSGPLKNIAFYEVHLRERNPWRIIELADDKAHITEALTLPYQGPKYASTFGARGIGKLADNLNIGRNVRNTPPGAAIPPNDRGGLAGVLEGSRDGHTSPGTPAPPRPPLRLEKSLGFSLEEGIRLEVDILCDERLSPRVYGLRYTRSASDGNSLVDVMLKFSQPPPR